VLVFPSGKSGGPTTILLTKTHDGVNGMMPILAASMAELFSNPIFTWSAFSVFILAMLGLDLFVFHKSAHEVKFKEAVGWSVFWVTLGLLFSVVIYYKHQAGMDAGLTFGATTQMHVTDNPNTDLVPTGPGDAVVKYITAYLIEKSLSVDNLFVFLMLFSFFKIPAMYQHRVLFWGIIGALVLRTVFVFAGVALMAKFHWLIYVFGGVLIISGIKMAWGHGSKDDADLSKNWVVRLAKKILPVSDQLEGDKFLVKRAGKWIGTPLLLALLVVEATDVVFAVDSIPAVLAITSDPFIVLTSNIFAILGLRALYFALAGFMDLFVYLGYGLALILVFIGCKMMMVDFFKVPTLWSLGIVGLILAVSIVLSLVLGSKKGADGAAA
jgi:tellurite resistance protein TerC